MQDKLNLNTDYILDTWQGERPKGEYKALIGYGGFIQKDKSINTLEMLYSYIQKGAEESCGQCFPCRNGLKKLAKRLHTFKEKQYSTADLDFLLSQARLIMASARCDIGQKVPKALVDIIESAPKLLENNKNKNTYTHLITAPCINACPSHVDIPNYIEMIRVGKNSDGLSCVMQDCVMPGTIGRVCVRPCESACKRQLTDKALSIKTLKRYLFDQSLEKDTESNFTKKEKKDKKIAIIGAGPAGLSCAYYLAKEGYQPTIFEKEDKSGGMAKYGIPDYRLPPAVLEEEVKRIQDLGVEIIYNTEIGKHKTIEDLKKEGYALVYIAAGSQKAPLLNCEGECDCACGLISGIDYLHEAAKGNKVIDGKKVLVLGGGNVAMDCVRTAKRHGFEDVGIIYRRTEEEMPADKVEIHDAKHEGINFYFLLAPQKIITENGKVKALICQKMQLGKPDASGRCSPIPIEGEMQFFDCDVIIPAIGQKTDLAKLFEGLDIEEQHLFDRSKNVRVDEITGKLIAKTSSIPLFGMGDCVTGPISLISALAGGKRSAEYGIKLLENREDSASLQARLEADFHTISLFAENENLPPSDLKEPLEIQELPLIERLQGFAEVELPIATRMAKKEASRCLRCYRIVMIAN